MLTCMATAVAIAALANAQHPRPDEAKLVAYAKAIDVANLDATLPHQRLADWIAKQGVRAAEVVWRSSDCSLKPDPTQPDEPRPLCVNFAITVGKRQIAAILFVGTLQKGIDGPPRFESMLGVSGPADDPKPSVGLKLSELPRLLAEVRGARAK